MRLPHGTAKRDSGWARRAAALGAALLLLMGLAFAVGYRAVGRSAQSAPPLALPDGERPRYTVRLRWPGGESPLAVTEEILWRNGTGVALDRLCLRVNAAAYGSESASPVAAEDLYDRAYPDGFNAGGLLLEGCWVNDRLVEARFDASAPELLWLDAPVAVGETLALTLRFRMSVPACAGLYGRSGDVTRLAQALPTMAVWAGGAWDTAPLSAYAIPQDMDFSDVTFSADLPDGCRLLTGEGQGANQLAALIVPQTLPQAMARVDGTELLALAETKAQAEAALAAMRAVWPVLIRLYGRLPLERLTLVCLPLPDSGYSAPGLVLLDSSLTGAELAHRAAYWLAGQWFGWAVNMDNAREGWFAHAARQWATLRCIRETEGGDSESAYRRLWVELPMRENLHAAVTAGMEAQAFPDQATYLTVMDGRAAAFFCALDTWLPGGFDSFLSALTRRHAFTRISRADFLDAACETSGQDLAPLMLDWLDTYILESQ